MQAEAGELSSRWVSIGKGDAALAWLLQPFVSHSGDRIILNNLFFDLKDFSSKRS